MQSFKRPVKLPEIKKLENYWKDEENCGFVINM